MFSPNCVVLLPAPEISLKGPAVRSFMIKRLKKSIILYLKHFEVDYSSIVSLAGRMVVYSFEPQKVILALKYCFGINTLFLAEDVKYSSIEDLQSKCFLISEGIVSSGTFAVRGKSFSNLFSTKKMEEYLGSALIEKLPSLKVKLKSPEKEVFCIAFKINAFFYFSPNSGAGGMPLGVQGRAGVFVPEQFDKKILQSLVFSLMKTGVSVSFVGKVFDASELEKFNCFDSFSFLSVESAKASFAEKKLLAFFSPVTSTKEVNLHSTLFGVKVFAPLIEDSCILSIPLI
ncbi:MAG: THUMP domain-containing protein [Candidatus Diapherotrites archaeon]|nr:THUMP domain-containing protein [Candidatus Diapherotrites archaeon]